VSREVTKLLELGMMQNLIPSTITMCDFLQVLHTRRGCILSDLLPNGRNALQLEMHLLKQIKDEIKLTVSKVEKNLNCE
jgi:hypothetical protein